MDKDDHGLQSHVRAIQRIFEEASTSFQASCSCIVQSTGRFAASLQEERRPPRGQLFASVNLPFARSGDSEGGKGRKKKRIPRPGERLHEQEPAEADNENKLEAAEPKPKPKKQEKRRLLPKAKLVIVKDEDDQDTPEIVRRLNDVKEPPPEDDTDAAAQMLTKLRASLSDDQKEAFDQEVWDRLSRRMKVDVDGETMSLRRLAKEAAQEKAAKEVSASEPAIRHKLREDVKDATPGWALRQAASKMQLKPEEQDALELDRLGVGHLFSPRRFVGYRYGVLHDFAWGMFGRIEAARRALEEKWSGQNPDEVLAQQDFYNDILANADKIELTLMMTAERPMPLKQLRERFLERQCRILSSLQEDSAPEVDAQMGQHHQLILAGIKRNATVGGLKRSGLIDEAGNVIPDSKLIVTVGPRWQLTAEAITSGQLRDQRTVFLGHWEDAGFAKGVMGQFLGLPAVDPVGKCNVGNGVLYVTNGFDFQIPEACGNPNQFYNEEGDSNEVKRWSSIAMEGVPNSPDMFAMAEKPAPKLLTGIAARSGVRQS